MRRLAFNRLTLWCFSLAVLGVVAACAPVGDRSRDAFDRPLRGDYMQLVNVGDRLVEIDSAGRIVRAAAPDGQCFSHESIQTLGEAVFMLIADCGGGEYSGVVSLSIGNGPLAADLEAMEAFFRTDEGRIGLGYGGDDEDIALLDVRRVGDTLFAAVEDRSEFGPAFAGDEICRAFIEVNGRMVVATSLSRRTDPPAPGALRAELETVIDALRRANS